AMAPAVQSSAVHQLPPSPSAPCRNADSPANPTIQIGPELTASVQRKTTFPPAEGDLRLYRRGRRGSPYRPPALEAADLIAVALRKCDVVEALDQPLAGERVERKRRREPHCRGADARPFDLDGELAGGVLTYREH